MKAKKIRQRPALSMLLLCAALAGLCAPTLANTTALRAPAALDASADNAAPPAAFAAPGIALAPNRSGPLRIALMLPLRIELLGPAAQGLRAAAQALRDGFFAAYEASKSTADGANVSIDVIETSDTNQNTLASYQDAAARHDIVVGPLLRSAVSALAQSNVISKPTLALNQPENAGDSEPVLPPNLLVIGLSVEEEARQIANWASADTSVRQAFAVGTSISWQRRAARAFTKQWQKLGLDAQLIELGSGGALNANALQDLKKRIAAEQPAFLFVALDAVQTRQLRAAIGNEVLLYGTSQLNPFAATDWPVAPPANELDGVYLVDIPWQLLSDQPAMTLYPRLALRPEQSSRNPDQERLYALGIDAFKIALELGRQTGGARNEIQIDGVTGKLKINLGQGITRFERVELPAWYQNGAVTSLPVR